MSLIIVIVVAVLIDQWLGEPKQHHPLNYFGNWAQAIEKRFNHSNASQLSGVIALLLAVVPIIWIAHGIDRLLGEWFIFDVLILYFCIAPNSLATHAMAVSNGLTENLESARVAVARIVSRDTDKMEETEVVKATVESVLENGNDAIFGALFWFVIAGPLGALTYRLVNTLDAMWGYKNARFLKFGWASAKLDDVLNWAPAILTAWTYSVAGEFSKARQAQKNHSALLESPNGGKVMTAGAGALDITLGGSCYYYGELVEKPEFGGEQEAQNSDIHRAVDLVHRSITIWIATLFVLVLIF